MFKEERKGASEGIISGSNRIAEGTKIIGEIISQSDFRIDGELQGNIQTSGRIVLGKTGVIQGKITAVNADIEGIVLGNIDIKNMLTLKATANIQGDVKTEKLTIEPGAIFNVTCQMGVNQNAQPSNELETEIAENEQNDSYSV